MAALGEAVAVLCTSQGYPKPVCRIYHEGNLVNVNGSVYIIQNFTPADQGEYKCNCSNAAAVEEVNITLALYGKCVFCATVTYRDHRTEHVATVFKDISSKCYLIEGSFKYRCYSPNMLICFKKKTDDFC